MAEKRTSIYVLDVGASMGETHGGRSETDLEYAMQYVWDKITTTVSTGRKTDVIGVVGFRTDGTDNELMESDDSYQNITVLSPISQFLMTHLRQLKSDVKPSNTNKGDGISALVIAIQMITTFCRHLKYIKDIYLVTNARGSFDPDGLEEIAQQIKDRDLNLTVLGVDFDDLEYGFKEEDKDPQKSRNEELLKKLCDDCGGVFGTLQEAVNELEKPRLKTVRPIATFKGTLTLGDAANMPTALSIDVERYPKTMQAKPASASRYVEAPVYEGGEGAPGRTVELEDRSGAGPDLQAVKSARVYQVDDESAPGGKKDIDRDELEQGYTYGRTVVYISETDKSVTVLQTEPGLQILGFIPEDKYKRYFSMSNTHMIVPQKANDKASLALSSFIHALHELESYAVARLVKKENVAPLMVILAPSIDTDFECLIDVEVPFTEDIRPYKFPPLGRVKTVTGKTLDTHRFIPTNDMEKYMSDYVDSMDLSRFGKDDEGKPIEYAPIEDTFSPIVHRVGQVIRHRAINPQEPIPPPPEVLIKYSHPPEELVSKSKEHLDKLIAACNIKQVEPKAKGRRRGKKQPKPKSGLNIEELLGSEPAGKKIRISMENAIPEYRQVFKGTDIEAIEDATGQLIKLVEELIKTSVADANYARACEMIKVARGDLIDMDMADTYNDAIRNLKESIFSGKLDGNRKDMWRQIKTNRLGLITKNESDATTKTTEEEARAFL